MITLSFYYDDRLEERFFERSALEEAWTLAKSVYQVAKSGVAFEGLMKITLTDATRMVDLKWVV